ncbi:MAG: AAA family ATPase [Candidatus Paceibacteria bacterium]
MRLLHLELHGFKSFAKKTSLDFEHPIVSIVGPNGSGKSNVVEAFRFVLGEQSMKSMRGKGSTDMIFKGSKGVPKGSKALVSIYFNNSDKIFKLSNDAGEPVDLSYDTISISREVYGDGLNRYLLNDSEVRLKDITQLLASVHIGASGHHIISQGEADRILNANAKDKKEIIEEALGLKVYQYKIKEGERKLERSLENMKEAIMQKRENTPHLTFLKKQIEKIERAREMRDELALLYTDYLGKEGAYLYKEVKILNDERDLITRELTGVQSLLASLATEVGEKESANISELKKLEQKIADIRRIKGELERKLGRIEGLIESEERRALRVVESPSVTITREEFDVFRNDTDAYLAEALKSSDVSTLTSIVHKIKDIFDRFAKLFEGEKITYDTTELDNLKQSAKAVAIELSTLEEERSLLEEKAEDFRVKIKEEMDALRDKEREKFSFEVKQQELSSKLRIVEVKYENLKRQEEDFENEKKEAIALVGLPGEIKTAADVPVNRASQEDLKRRIERIKIKLEDAGIGNGEDIQKEYNQVLERDMFLTKEIEDLEKSIDSTKMLIADLRDRLQVEFADGVKKINKEFDQFFSLMFGGGSGSLTLVTQKKRTRYTEDEEESGTEDEEAETEEGIEINVSLPHKKVKELHSLSGGERSLTSIALLFAMSAVNPPPFLILDETDAALDEANSRKYGDMLERLSKHSQLIVVTHNRETMSRAGVLYGVTIGADGASKLLSVKFEEAQAIAK